MQICTSIGVVLITCCAGSSQGCCCANPDPAARPGPGPALPRAMQLEAARQFEINPPSPPRALLPRLLSKIPSTSNSVKHARPTSPESARWVPVLVYTPLINLRHLHSNDTGLPATGYGHQFAKRRAPTAQPSNSSTSARLEASALIIDSAMAVTQVHPNSPGPRYCSHPCAHHCESHTAT